MAAVTEPVRRAILFANARSGRAKRWTFRAIEACDRFHIELVSTYFDLSRDAIDRALRHASSQGIQTVLAAGGDGTQGTIAAAVAGTQFTLGVIPTGTANDFARSLDIPVDPQAAVKVVSEGRATRVDLGEVGDQIFCHVATIGINTEFADTAERLRPYFRRASYPIAAIWAYVRRHPFEFEIETGAKSESGPAFEIALVNAPVYGGPAQLEIPESDLEDRHLLLLVVADISPRMIFRALPAVIRREPLRLPHVSAQPVTSVRIVTKPRLDVVADGQHAGSTPVECKVLPGALRVYVPASFEGRAHGMVV